MSEDTKVDMQDIKHNASTDEVFYRKESKRVEGKDKVLAKKLEKSADSLKEVQEHIKSREA